MKIYETLEDGSLLSEEGTSIPVGHRLYQQAQQEVIKGEATINPYVEPTPTVEEQRQEAMMTGVDFNGVMCSAFKEDQWGLGSIKDFVMAGNDIDFEFVNGNVVTLTSANLAAFEAVWIPFRQAHLRVKFTGS